MVTRRLLPVLRKRRHHRVPECWPDRIPAACRLQRVSPLQGFARSIETDGQMSESAVVTATQTFEARSEDPNVELAAT